MCNLLSEKLHELINKEEYENKKLVRLIDYEKERQTLLQSQLDKLRNQIDDTEKQNALLSREIHDVERQVTANQSLIFTLTCANKMSHQHVNETHKKLIRLEEDGRKRADQYENALQCYRETWSNHQKVYCSFPGVPQIMLLEDEVFSLRDKVQDLENKLKSARLKKQESKENSQAELQTEETERPDKEVVREVVIELVAVDETPMVTVETTVTDEMETDTPSATEHVEMVTEGTGGDALVDSVSVMCVDFTAQCSSYFSTEVDKIKEDSQFPSSSTPNIISGIPSISPFNEVSPVPAVPCPSVPASIPNIPSPNIPSSSLKPASSGMVSSAPVRRSIPKLVPKLTNKFNVTPPASPRIVPLKVSTPKLFRLAPSITSPAVPKLATPKPAPSPRLTSTLKPVSRPTLIKPPPPSPKVAAQLTPQVSSTKLATPTKLDTPKQAVVTTPKLAPLKPLSTPKMLSTPTVLSTPKMRSTPKALSTPKPLSTPKLVSTPKVFATPKQLPTKRVPQLAAASFATPQRVKRSSKEEFFTPAVALDTDNGSNGTDTSVANGTDTNGTDTSVYATPLSVSPAKEVNTNESSFDFDQFQTPAAGDSTFNGSQAANDQFNFGFVETESDGNSAFGMFGGREDPASFGGDSGFGGDSTGFSFNFSGGASEDTSSSESSCNALFG